MSSSGEKSDLPRSSTSTPRGQRMCSMRTSTPRLDSSASEDRHSAGSSIRSLIRMQMLRERSVGEALEGCGEVGLTARLNLRETAHDGRQGAKSRTNSVLHAAATDHVQTDAIRFCARRTPPGWSPPSPPPPTSPRAPRAEIAAGVQHDVHIGLRFRLVAPDDELVRPGRDPPVDVFDGSPGHTRCSRRTRCCCCDGRFDGHRPASQRQRAEPG